MRFMNIPHFPNPINVDTIVNVTWAPAKWYNRRERHAYRKYIWWGKPQRGNGPSLLGAYYRPAEVVIHLSGDDYRARVCRPNEAERFADDIKAFLRTLSPSGPERIVAAAIERIERIDLEHGAVYMTYTQPAPARHHHILHSMPPDPGTDHDVLINEQGFLTSTGRFVSRKVAMGLAVAAGQVSPTKVQSPDLFSEDLW